MSANPEQPNNPQNVRRIVDHAQLHQIVEKLFCQLPIHAIENNQKHIVQVLEYKQPHFEILHKLAPAQTRKIVLDKDSNTMLLECAVLERTARGGEVLKPQRLTLMQRGIRHEARVSVASGKSNTVTNVLPHAEFYKFNAATYETRDKLMAQYITALKGMTPDARVRIDLQKSSRLTVRMKGLQDFNLPIFAPRMTEQRQGDDLSLKAMPSTEYEKIMRSDALPGDYIGEICEPIFYGGVFIFGYVQILSSSGPVTMTQYHSVRQMTRRLEADLHQKRCFPQNQLAGQIVDLSHGGIGFVHPMQRSVFTAAGIADKIVFDVVFDANTSAVFTGKIRNMNAEEKGKRYGVEFEYLSPECEALLARATGQTG